MGKVWFMFNIGFEWTETSCTPSRAPTPPGLKVPVNLRAVLLHLVAQPTLPNA